MMQGASPAAFSAIVAVDKIVIANRKTKWGAKSGCESALDGTMQHRIASRYS